jgi:hypothetical protein
VIKKSEVNPKGASLASTFEVEFRRTRRTQFGVAQHREQEVTQSVSSVSKLLRFRLRRRSSAASPT